MTTRQATIQNKMGIHCRPSAVILKTVKPYEGSVSLDAGEGSSPLQSVMDLLGLGLEHGRSVTIHVEGPGEEEMADQLRDLFETEFDFLPQA